MTDLVDRLRCDSRRAISLEAAGGIEILEQLLNHAI